MPIQILSLVLDEVDGGRLPDLRVINYSVGTAKPANDYLAQFPNKTCGPDANDDEPRGTNPGSKQYCTPNNEDGWLFQIRQVGLSARPGGRARGGEAGYDRRGGRTISATNSVPRPISPA